MELEDNLGDLQNIDDKKTTVMAVKIDVDNDAGRYLTYIFDQFSLEYSMTEYIPAIYWTIDSGTENIKGKFELNTGAGYYAVLVQISETKDDLKFSVGPEKLFALRLDPKLIGKEQLQISLVDGKIAIV